ncbi:MAG TPA: protein translocase subunit SecD, partial [Tepidisphaeraceae bacterium]
MQTHYSGRVATILGVLLFALYFIFPYFYKGDLHPNLKPGIDIAGGTKLIYEIKLPDDGQYRPDLSRDVMQALKKRVDPDGVKNLVWRPQGPTRLEIQMPLTSTSAESEKIRENYTKAQQQLQQTNVRIGDVIHAIEDIKNHDARRDEINRLAQTSESRGNLYGAMASAWDRIQAAREKKDAAAQASATIEYEKLKKQLNVTNIDVSELQSILDATKSVREAKLKQLREENKDFPSRIAAIDNFVTMHDAFKGVRGAIDDAAGLKRLLKGSGVLEFRIVARDAGPEIQTMAAQLKKDGPRPKAGDTLRWYEVARPEEFKTYNYPIQEYNGKMYILLDITPERSMINGPGIKPWALESAYREQLDGGKTVVGFKFNVQGGNYFGTLTGANKGQALAIVLDDKVISAPNINTQINQSGYIEAGDKGYTEEELNYLISTLNAGSLPAQLADEPISEQTIKPQLGEDNLRAGLLSCIIGLAVVAVFMIVYYHLAGVVATIAVVMNVLLILGAMAAIDATFTLPGIAGIVLTIGASVDANVLIFERLREEQHRGVSLRAAIRTAYDKAWSAILDANVTTIITAFILYWLGSEEVKGFGLTLLFGLVSSLFTALFVTKTIFMILIEKYGVSHLGSLPLSYPKWDKFLRPNIDWMAKARYFIATSVILTVLGLIAFFVKVKQREMFDIEFAGGTSVTFELKKPMELKKVRDKLDQFPGALPSLAVVQIGNDNLVYEAVTPNTDAPAVKEAVLSAFGENLHMELRSKFEHMDEKSDAAIESGAIVPITAEQPPTLNSFTPAHWQTYIGGAAIKLVNL